MPTDLPFCSSMFCTGVIPNTSIGVSIGKGIGLFWLYDESKLNRDVLALSWFLSMDYRLPVLVTLLKADFGWYCCPRCSPNSNCWFWTQSVYSLNGPSMGEIICVTGPTLGYMKVGEDGFPSPSWACSFVFAYSFSPSPSELTLDLLYFFSLMISAYYRF